MVTAIIQARVGSTRFPRKVFAPLVGRPLIWHVVDRVRACRSVQHVVLATTVNPADDILAQWAVEHRVNLYRGSENDVLGRFHGAAAACDAQIIARITADDPFKDPTIIDRVADLLQGKGLDFACNNNPPSYPEGLDTEIFTRSSLDRAHMESTEPFEREHVTQYFYRHPGLFSQANLANAADLSFLRWTIDTPTDYAMAERVYKELYQKDRVFLMEDILALLRKKPEIAAINANVVRSAMYKTSLKSTE